jgi:hypothetical protein
LFKTHIVSADTEGLGIVNTAAVGSGSGAGIQGFSSTVPNSADDRLAFYTFGAFSGSTKGNGAAISGWSSEAWTISSQQGSYLKFETTDTDSATRTERMRVDQAGGVSIGSLATAEALLEVQGAEGIDAAVALDADDGDDNADTWFIESEAADNDLSFVNHTTEVFKITSAGAVTAVATSPSPATTSS